MKTRALRSICAPNNSGTLANHCTNPKPQFARTSASAPPNAASTPASVSNCATRRGRLAPRAARKTISPRRASARASVRLATLAQAMRRRNPTALNRTRSGSRRLPVITCFNPTAKKRRSVLSAGSVTRLPRKAVSALSRSDEMPGFRRPMTRRRAI